MIHPEYVCIDEQTLIPVAETLTPIYRTGNGLSQRMLTKLIAVALECIVPEDIPELLPQVDVPTLYTALMTLHNPPPDIQVNLLEQAQHPLQQRLIIEELVLRQTNNI